MIVAGLDRFWRLGRRLAYVVGYYHDRICGRGQRIVIQVDRGLWCPLVESSDLRLRVHRRTRRSPAQGSFEVPPACRDRRSPRQRSLREHLFREEIAFHEVVALMIRGLKRWRLVALIYTGDLYKIWERRWLHPTPWRSGGGRNVRRGGDGCSFRGLGGHHVFFESGPVGISLFNGGIWG